MAIVVELHAVRIHVLVLQLVLILLFASTSYQPSTHAALRSDFGAPQPVSVAHYSGPALEPFMTPGGAALLFADPVGLGGRGDLQWAERVDDLHFVYRGRVPNVNTPEMQSTPTMDLSGTLYYLSPTVPQRSPVWRARWYAPGSQEVDNVHGIEQEDPRVLDFDVEISRDGEMMVLSEGQFFPGEPIPRRADLVLARRHADDFRRDDGAMLAALNTDALEYGAALTEDTLEIFFVRSLPLAGQPPRLFHAVRGAIDQPFAAAEMIANTEGAEGPTVAADGRGVYFHRVENGRARLYRLPCELRNRARREASTPALPKERSEPKARPDQESRKMKYTAPSTQRQAQA